MSLRGGYEPFGVMSLSKRRTTPLAAAGVMEQKSEGIIFLPARCYPLLKMPHFVGPYSYQYFTELFDPSKSIDLGVRDTTHLAAAGVMVIPIQQALVSWYYPLFSSSLLLSSPALSDTLIYKPAIRALIGTSPQSSCS